MTTTLPLPSSPTRAMPSPLPEPVQSAKQLPKAAPAVLRVISDGLASIVEQLAQETNQLHPKQQHFVGGLAWLVHSFAYFSVEYEQLLSELARLSSQTSHAATAFDKAPPASSVTPLHKLELIQSQPARSTLAFKDWSTLHIEEVDPSSPNTFTDGDEDNDDDKSVIELDTSDGVRRPNKRSISPPADVQIRPTDTFLTFLLSYHSFGFSSSDRSSPTNGGAKLTLPDFFVPSFATASERKVYSIMNGWRNTEDIRVCIQRCFAEMSAFEMRLHLEAEIFRTRDLPFGVVLYPLYPRPFERYLPWTNERFARLLGYDHEEMLLLCRTRRGFYSIYDTDSRETVLNAFHKAIPYGITSATFRVNLLGRSRKPVAAIVSMLIRYIQHVPVYTLSFVQPALGPGQCQVI